MRKTPGKKGPLSITIDVFVIEVSLGAYSGLVEHDLLDWRIESSIFVHDRSCEPLLQRCHIEDVKRERDVLPACSYTTNDPALTRLDGVSKQAAEKDLKTNRPATS